MRLGRMVNVKEIYLNILNLIQQKRCPHAIIIESKKSQDVTELVYDISKALVCMSKEKKPCGKCVGCRKFPNHPDVKKVQSTGVTKSFSVDTIRDIRQDANVIPNEAGCKVYIFMDADNFTVPAQNAFLKLLEEPPDNVYFILTVESHASLLSTVLSRATLYHVSVFDADVSEASVKIAKEIFESACKSSECELMLLGGKLQDRDIFMSLIDDLEKLYVEALRDLIKGDYIGSNFLNERKIIDVIGILHESRKLFQRNVNLPLLVTWMLMRIREKIFTRYNVL